MSDRLLYYGDNLNGRGRGQPDALRGLRACHTTRQIRAIGELIR